MSAVQSAAAAELLSRVSACLWEGCKQIYRDSCKHVCMSIHCNIQLCTPDASALDNEAWGYKCHTSSGWYCAV